MPSREEMPKLVAIAIVKSPKLLLKLSWRYLRMKKRAQRAEVTFRRRLEASGMDRETASRLAERYTSTASLRKMLKEIGIPGKVFNNGHK